MTKILYNVDDIFQDCDDGTDSVIMTIPPEIVERMGWVFGDVLNITVHDGKLLISKKYDNETTAV